MFLTSKAGSKTEKLFIGPFGDIDFDGPTNRPKEVDIDWFEVRDDVLIAGLADRYTSLGSSAPSGEPTRKLLIYDLATRKLILGQEVEESKFIEVLMSEIAVYTNGEVFGLAYGPFKKQLWIHWKNGAPLEASDVPLAFRYFALKRTKSGRRLQFKRNGKVFEISKPPALVNHMWTKMALVKK